MESNTKCVMESHYLNILEFRHNWYLLQEYLMIKFENTFQVLTDSLSYSKIDIFKF